MRARLLFAALALAGLGAPAAARDVVPAERFVAPFDANFPGCQDTAVLEKIAERFAEREARFWATNLTLVHFEHIRPIAWRPWGLDFIPRRFCTAQVTVSDGRKRRIDYSVREDLGIIGLTWGVDWCVSGLDRNRAYAPDCLMARP
jgi:hypothetical protein